MVRGRLTELEADDVILARVCANPVGRTVHAEVGGSGITGAMGLHGNSDGTEGVEIVG